MDLAWTLCNGPDGSRRVQTNAGCDYCHSVTWNPWYELHYSKNKFDSSQHSPLKIACQACYETYVT